MAYHASLSFTSSWSILKLLSLESGIPSNQLILYHLLLLLPSIFSSIRFFSNESALCTRWPKCCSFSFSISTSNEYSGLIFFRIDWFDWPPFCPRHSKESSPVPSFKSINSLVLSFLYNPTLTSTISWFFRSAGQNTEAAASATVLPMNFQGLFPLRLTGLISL